jgi:surface carbohydrate biosynthesis protein|tara:strand:- start:1959 stop:3089 length:1131 start_codon:yes stop_codon:yes gene_type:complete
VVKFFNHKIIQYKNNAYDAIIVDKSTSEFIKYCIPANVKYCEIGIRSEIPVIVSFKFFTNFLFNFVKTRKIILSSILSLAKINQAKIIISFQDNLSLMGQINRYNNKLLVISIQNGTRSKHSHHGWSNIKYFPDLYGCGLYEKDLIKSLGGTINKYIASGSLKYGIYKRHYFKNSNQKNNNLTFISSWRDKRVKKFEQIVSKSQIKIIPNLHKFSLEGKYNFQILTATKKNDLLQKNEKNYFLSLNNNADLNFLEKNYFYDSYHYCDNSRIIISYTSALAFEMYGLGIKTLFLGSINYINDSPGYPWREIFDFLPKLVKAEDDDYIKISEKISDLINLSNENYLEITKESRNYFMKYNNKFTHELVASRISNKLIQ